MSNPPKIRNCHEIKPGLDAGVNLRDNPQCRVGNAEREPEPRENKREDVVLTGRYIHEHELYHLFINQAGPHIELLLAFVGPGSPSESQPSDENRQRTRVVRLAGDVDDAFSDRYELYYRKTELAVDDKSLQCGVLLVHGSDASLEVEFRLDLQGFEIDQKDYYFVQKWGYLQKFAQSRAARYSTQPNLLEHHLYKTTIPAEVRTAHWFPITKKQQDALPKYILTTEVTLNPDNYQVAKSGQGFDYEALIRAFYDVKTSQLQRNIVEALDALVLNAYSAATQVSVEDGAIDAFTPEWFTDASLEVLARETLEVVEGTPRTFLTYTYDLLESRPEANIRFIEKYLGIQRPEGSSNYAADMWVMLIDAKEATVKKFGNLLGEQLGVPATRAKKIVSKITSYLTLGGLAGVLNITKEGDAAYEATYVIAMGGPKLGASLGDSKVVMHTTGSAQNIPGRMWRPEHIPGWAWLGDFGAAFWRSAGRGYSRTALSCSGSGATKPPGRLNINLSGWSDFFGNRGIGGSASFLYGVIVGMSSEGGEYDIDLPNYAVEKISVEYKVNANRLHFPINGAKLMDAGREVLEVFAAQELALLGVPSVKLNIDGYTDEPDDEFNNLILSRNRGISVYHYLKNILEVDLATGELETISSETSERDKRDEAAEKGTAYVIQDPSNGHVSICGHGEPEGNKNQAGYDARLRRVDVKLNGSLAFSLRRKQG